MLRTVVEAMEKLYKGYEDKTRTRTYNSNISKFLEDIMKSLLKYRIENEIPNDLRNKYKTDVNKLGVVNAIIENIISLRDASDIRTYYYISKNMDNADITNVINLYDRIPDTITNISEQEKMQEAVEVMGQMYVKNVSSYGGNTKYSLEQISKNVDSAYIRNQYNTLRDYDISEQKEEIKNKFKSLISDNNWFKCGDDCVRFMFSVIFYAQNGDIGTELKNNNSEKYYTMFGTNILTKNDNNYLFEDLGFDIYYIGDNYKGHEFGYDDLEDGDILIAYRTDTNEKGHVELYINDKYGKNGNGTYDWSFGWGSQKSRYPVNGSIGKTIKDDIDNKFDNDSGYNKKYLLDNFTNTNKVANKQTGEKYNYDLRYYKILRKVR